MRPAYVALGIAGSSVAVFVSIYSWRYGSVSDFWSKMVEISKNKADSSTQTQTAVLSPCWSDKDGFDVDLVDSGITTFNEVSSTSSYTSCEEGLTSNSESDSYYLYHTSSSESNLMVEGAVGMSTYDKHTKTSPLSQPQFYDLLRSPVVPSEDDRVGEYHGRSPTRDYEIVKRYSSQLSPSRVDEQCQTVNNIYSDIVPPLCPNTGTVIPDANVTTRRRHSSVNLSPVPRHD